jgi:Bacterial archaeo-eukaryotic release factor family 3
MRSVTVPDVRSMVGTRQHPCISIYMPTDGGPPGRQEDRIRWKNLVRSARRLLESTYPPGEANRLISSIADAYQERPARPGSVAVLRSPDVDARYWLPVKVPEIMVVSGSFHTKPLVSFLDRNRRYFVLALAELSATLYEGTPFSLRRLDVQFPTFDQLHPETAEPYRGVHGGRGMSRASARHGWREPSAEYKSEILRRFRSIDRAVSRHLQGEAGPLVLAGVGYYHPIYRSVSCYPHLLEEGIEGNVEHARLGEIYERAWPIVAAYETDVIATALARYASGLAAERAIDGLQDVARAAARGRVRLLLHAEGMHLWGYVDPVTGDCRVHEQQWDAEDADVLDDICEMVLLRGGDVVEVPRDRMPASSPIAALLRY